MTTSNKLNEFNHAEEPARQLLERLGWTYVPAEHLASERVTERDVLLKDRLRAALLRLNDGLTGAQAERVIYDLERADGIGMPRNQLVHEYLTYGMSLTVEGPSDRDIHTVRFFDFDEPEGGLNEFVVTTQFRVRRGNEKGDPERRPAHGHPRPGAVRQRHPIGGDGGQVADAHGRVENPGRPPAAALPGGRIPVGRSRRAGAVPLQPPVRGPLRSPCSIFNPIRAGERVLRMEVGASVHGAGGPRPVRRGAPGPGPAHRGPAIAEDSAGYPPGLRGL